MTLSLIRIKAEHVFIMCCCLKKDKKQNIHSQTTHPWQYIFISSTQSRDINRYKPSPNPKQGIKLSSSKGDKVRPIIEIACSYGLGVLPIAWRLFLLNEYLPTIIECEIHKLIILTALITLICFEFLKRITCPLIALCEVNTKYQIWWFKASFS